MKSLKNLYVIGPGPSSSHTIGPYRAGNAFLKLLDGHEVKDINVTLFGSLAFTGKGHGTDEILKKVFKDYPINIIFDYKTPVNHPNTFTISASFSDGTKLEKTYVSIGGGSYEDLSGAKYKPRDHYPFKSFEEIKAYMKEKGYTSLDQIVDEFEPNILHT